MTLFAKGGQEKAKVLIVYYSSTGNVKKMASLVEEGAKNAGASVQVSEVEQVDVDWLPNYDAIILGSPTDFADVTTETKALIDRAGLVAKANGDMFARKVGAAVLAVRRGGSIHAFDTINHFFTISQMIIPGSNYWNFGIGLNPGDVDGDEEGKQTMSVLGQNMAWLLKKIHA